jgi:plastocyanin
MDVLRPWSNPTHICSPPSAPTGVVAAPGDGNAAVAWLQPANDGGAAITGYTVTPHDLTSGSDGTAVPASGTRVTVEGLINGHTYTFTVTARNVAGTSAASGASSPVTPRVGNPPPAAAAGTASPTNATTISTGDDPATTGGTATSVTVPSGTAGGTVSVVQAAASVSAASGYQFGRVQVDVSAPTATATNPLTLVFTIAPPLDEPPPPDPVTLASTQIFRTEGTGTPVLVADCSTAGEALPDGSPCVSSRRYTTINGQAYIQLTVLSASASHWNTARPTARAVSVSDRGYSPQNVTIQPGAYVRWTFTGSRRHSVTDSVGLGNARSPWFDSGARLSGSYSFNFPAAGRFSYRSTARGDSMTGAVLVPVVATPTTGHATTSFSVIWSTRQLSGYVFNVQYRFKPAGSPNWRLWTNWKSGVATASSAFVPSQGAGTYAFRAQMRNSATGRSSDYSPDTTITVS